MTEKLNLNFESPSHEVKKFQNVAWIITFGIEGIF